MVTPDRRFHRRGLFDAQAALLGGGAFVSGLAAQAKLVSAWKPDADAQTFNDYKGTNHFALVDPLSKGITWQKEAGGGSVVGFGIGLASDNAEIFSGTSPHGEALWPALDYFSLHFSVRSALAIGASNSPLGVQNYVNGVLGQELLFTSAWSTNTPTDVNNSPGLVGFYYVDDADSATATETTEGYQAAAQDPTQPSPAVLADVCCSLGSDGMSRVWQNGVLVFEQASAGSTKKLWKPAGTNKLFTGEGSFTAQGGGQFFDNNYFLGPVLLYDDAITTADVLTNRALFKSLGYASLP